MPGLCGHEIPQGSWELPLLNPRRIPGGLPRRNAEGRNVVSEN